MQGFYTRLGHFLIGISDSLSLKWITGILFFTNPRTKRILPESLQLQKTLGRSIMQAGLITTVIPLIVLWLGFTWLYLILTGLSLIFTYGYLIFYNMDVTDQAMKIIAWKQQHCPELMPEADVRERINILTDISNQIQSFIFEMVYYTPMNLLLIVITLFDETYFPILLVVMDSFFNAAFYYFRKWPYDRYNVAFLEKQMAYSLGYGFFVSLVSNVLLPSTMSIGGYLLISQWMIINAICHSPPAVEFNSFGQIWNVLTDRDQRRQLRSAYNIHRVQLVSVEYQRRLLNDCYFMKSFFLLTQRINNYLSEYMQLPQRPHRQHPQPQQQPQNNPHPQQPLQQQQNLLQNSEDPKESLSTEASVMNNSTKLQ